MFVRRVFAAALFVGLSTAVQAGGEVSMKDDPAPAKTYNWDGVYVGVGIGAGSFDYTGSLDIFSKKARRKIVEKCYQPSQPVTTQLTTYLPMMMMYDPCGPYGSGWFEVYDSGWEYSRKYYKESLSFENDEWHMFGTLQLGYDRLIHNRFLIGAFADVDIYQDADTSFNEKLYKYHYKVGKVAGDLEIESQLNIGGRLGFLLNPRILVYGVGGYTKLNLKGDVGVYLKGYHGYPGAYVGIAVPDSLSGHFYGGGAELKLRENVSLKVEYRRSDLDFESASAKTTNYKTYGPYPKDCYYSNSVSSLNGGSYVCRKTYKKKRFLKGGLGLDGEVHSVRANLVFKLGSPHHREPVEPLK